MSRYSLTAKVWAVAAACAFCSSSESDGPCSVLCALPLAFTVTVTSSATGASVPGSYVSGDPYGSGNGDRCNQALASTCCDQAPGSTCYLDGFAGTYTIQVGAPGFQTQQRSLTVATGKGSHCCPGTSPGHLDVALVAVP